MKFIMKGQALNAHLKELNLLNYMIIENWYSMNFILSKQNVVSVHYCKWRIRQLSAKIKTKKCICQFDKENLSFIQLECISSMIWSNKLVLWKPLIIYSFSYHIFHSFISTVKIVVVCNYLAKFSIVKIENMLSEKHIWVTYLLLICLMFHVRKLVL